MCWLLLVSLIPIVATASAKPIRSDQIDVVDGDPVLIDGERVRLLGFDTPETQFVQYRCDVEREKGWSPPTGPGTLGVVVHEDVVAPVGPAKPVLPVDRLSDPAIEVAKPDIIDTLIEELK